MKQFKIYISLAILFFINFLFSIKYIPRYFNHGIVIAFIILIIQICSFIVFKKVFFLKKNRLKIFTILFFLIVLILILFSKYYISIESLNVDRWSVIYNFFQEFNQGNYPYYAKSNMGNYPGPMPFYFLISYPFYLLNFYSLLSGLGYLIIIYFLFRESKDFFLLFLLSSCLFLYWEITTRSNLFTFSLFIVLILHKFDNEFSKKSIKKLVFLAIFIGLLLSTRSVYALAYVVYFIPILISKNKLRKKLVNFILISVFSFISTFAPFIIFYKDDFLEMNPFIIQSSYFVPFTYNLLFFVLAALFSLFVKNKNDKLFYSGVSIFFSILIYSIYVIMNSSQGIYQVILAHQIDISYYIFCIPFLIFFLLQENKLTLKTQ